MRSSLALLVEACEKFFHMLEVNYVGVVNIIDVVDRDPPPQLTAKAK